MKIIAPLAIISSMIMPVCQLVLMAFLWLIKAPKLVVHAIIIAKLVKILPLIVYHVKTGPIYLEIVVKIAEQIV